MQCYRWEIRCHYDFYNFLINTISFLEDFRLFEKNSCLYTAAENFFYDLFDHPLPSIFSFISFQNLC